MVIKPRAHPRVGGENPSEVQFLESRAGSSPRGRGKLPVFRPVSLPDGLIPAWAGKTSWDPGRCGRCAAHPRVGGENRSRSVVPFARAGSSPRGRGKRHPPGGCMRQSGLIPAWAGKTSRFLVCEMGNTAHPRVGGENSGRLEIIYSSVGSSPRGRGKLILPCELRYTFGLIPAWAGKTQCKLRPRV